MIVVHLLRRCLNQVGYDVRRHAVPVENPFAVLPLVVDSLIRCGGRPFFVQVGANDGVRSDPIRSIVLTHSLPGVLVEPLPDLFAKLTANYHGRPGLKFENAAIADRTGDLPFYRIRPDADLPEWCQGIGSFDPSHVRGGKFNDPRIAAAVEEIRVPTSTFADLLTKHSVAAVDLLQVDVEGRDDHVVLAALQAGQRPRIINYEFVHLPLARRLALRTRLRTEGYQFIDVGKDTLAVRPDDTWRLEG